LVEELKKRVQEYNDKTGGNYNKEQKELKKKNAAKKKQEKNDASAKSDKGDGPAKGKSDGSAKQMNDGSAKQEKPAKGDEKSDPTPAPALAPAPAPAPAPTAAAAAAQKPKKESAPQTPTQGCHAPSTLTLELTCKEVGAGNDCKFEIIVGVLSASNMPVGDRVSSDPYVKIRLGESNQLKTHVIKKTLNPEWNRQFPAVVLKEKPQKLQFEVYDNDKLSKDELLGVVVIAYDEIEWDGEKKTVTQDLGNRMENFLDSGTPAPAPAPAPTPAPRGEGKGKGSDEGKPQKEVAPGVNKGGEKPAMVPAPAPAAEEEEGGDVQYEIITSVVRASNLPVGDRTSSDPYVKVHLGKSFSQKTKVVKKSLNPTWDRRFDAVTLTEKPQEVVFQVYDEDKLSKDELLGEARIQYAELEWDGEEKSIALELSNRMEHFLQPGDQRQVKESKQGAAFPSVLWVTVSSTKVALGGEAKRQEKVAKEGGKKEGEGKKEGDTSVKKVTVAARYKEGDVVEANKKDRGRWRAGKIVACNSTGTFDVKYEDGTKEAKVEPGRIRAVRDKSSGEDEGEFSERRRRRKEKLPNFQQRVACRKLWYAMDPLKPQPNGQTLRQMINTCDPNDSGLVYRADLEEILFLLEAPVSSGSYHSLSAGSGEALLSAREVRAVIRMLHTRRDGLINYYELLHVVEEEVMKAEQLSHSSAQFGYEQDPYATEYQQASGYGQGTHSMYGNEHDVSGYSNASYMTHQSGTGRGADNAIAEAVLGQLHDRQAIQWFQTMDTNRSGYLSRQELCTALARLGVSLNDTELRWVFVRFDTNGDGLISLPEFVDSMEAYGGHSGSMAAGAAALHHSSHLYQRPPFSPVKHAHHRPRPNNFSSHERAPAPRSPIGYGGMTNGMGARDRRGAADRGLNDCQAPLGERVRMLLQERVDVDGAFAVHERASGGTRLPPGAIRRDHFELTCRELGMPLLASQLDMVSERFSCDGGYGYGMAGVMYREFVAWALETLPMEWRMRHGYGTTDKDKGHLDGYGYGHSGHDHGRAGAVYDHADREESNKLRSERGMEGLAGLNTKELDQWYDEEASPTQRKHFDQICRSMTDYRSEKRREHFGPSPLEQSLGGSGGSFGGGLGDSSRAGRGRVSDRVSTPKPSSSSRYPNSPHRSPRHRNVWVGDPLANVEEEYTASEKEAQMDMSTTMYIDLLKRTTDTTLKELEIDHQETVRTLDSSRRMDDLAVSWRDDRGNGAKESLRTPRKSGSGWDDDGDDLRVTPRATPRGNRSGWDDSDDEKDGWRSTPRTTRRLRY
jgi:Ca2+-binding EF-hand superfamily protein